jgi:hypothetical protein
MRLVLDERIDHRVAPKPQESRVIAVPFGVIAG